MLFWDLRVIFLQPLVSYIRIILKYIYISENMHLKMSYIWFCTKRRSVFNVKREWVPMTLSPSQREEASRINIVFRLWFNEK